MPTVNKGQLREAIETVRNQPHDNWKLIVGGDGFIPDLSYDDDRISVVGIPRTAEAGLMRNKLCRLASTEWVGMIDDDDELTSIYMDHWNIEKDRADVIVFQMDNYGELLPPTGVYEVQHGRVGISFAVRRDIMLAHPFDGQGGGEDYRFLYVLKNMGYHIQYVHSVCYLVRPYLRRQ